jgi:hypothetical protein
MRRFVALLVVVSLAVPATALAQDNPFAPPPINPNAPVQTPAPTPTSTPDNGSLSGTGRTTLYVIGAALLIAFVGIGVWIARDARRALPESRRNEPVVAGPGQRRSPQVKQRARARTKAQRRARRRNRP